MSRSFAVSRLFGFRLCSPAHVGSATGGLGLLDCDFDRRFRIKYASVDSHRAEFRSNIDSCADRASVGAEICLSIKHASHLTEQTVGLSG